MAENPPDYSISKNLVTDYFFQIFFMGTSCVALSIKNIKNSSEQRNDVTKKMGGGGVGGGRCQALECGRARYLPSLIALLMMVGMTRYAKIDSALSASVILYVAG